MFPAPCEVDRKIYETKEKVLRTHAWFPAPLEVDRELYKEDWLRLLEKAIVSDPSRGR